MSIRPSSPRERENDKNDQAQKYLQDRRGNGNGARRHRHGDLKRRDHCSFRGIRSGKTTLINLIGALDSISDGDIIFDGKGLQEMYEKEKTSFRKHNLGFIFQNYNLIPVLTAYENVELAFGMFGRSELSNSACTMIAFGFRRSTVIIQFVVEAAIISLFGTLAAGVAGAATLALIDSVGLDLNALGGEAV